MRSGFSLLELMIVVSIAGILAAFGLPRARLMLETLAVERAAQEIRAAHMIAAQSAVILGRLTTLELDPDTLRVRAISGTDTIVTWVGVGPRAAGVTLTGPAHRLVYSPLGTTMGASNGTWRVTYGSAGRDIIVSRLGRMRLR